MRVSEIFYSIQGEGGLAGVPSVFIRTSGCNLRCRWCDTKYSSWAPEGEEQTVGTIMDTVLAFPTAAHCVLTGGEPMVAKDLPELADALREAGKHITIETAATVEPRGIACDLASLSPKLSNATPLPGEIAEGWIAKHEQRRLQPEVIAAWVEHYPFQLKFVVSAPEDIEEVDHLLGRLSKPVPAHCVLLMPEGLTVDAVRRSDAFLIDLCKERGYRYCNRLHLELFGNTRGT